MADALDSGSSVRKDVRVQIPFLAPTHTLSIIPGVLFYLMN